MEDSEVNKQITGENANEIEKKGGKKRKKKRLCTNRRAQQAGKVKEKEMELLYTKKEMKKHVISWR